jgi:tetratricopeptide (TPR) repeat protein
MEAQALCEQLGDVRQWGDSTTLLAEGALLSGDLKTSLNVESNLLEESRRRRNPLLQCMALFGVSSIYIRQGEYAKAIPMLEEELQILDELPNMASSINSNALLSLAHYRLGDVDKALNYASKVQDLASALSPTVYSLDIGFSSVAEVYFDLWDKALENPNGLLDANRFKQMSEKALKLLKGFLNIFPIGQPYLALYTGRRYWNMGKHQKAVKTWETGLEAAKKYRLLYEEGLLRVRLAAALTNEPDEQLVHLHCAAQIFETMGAVHDLKIVRTLAQQNRIRL